MPVVLLKRHWPVLPPPPFFGGGAGFAAASLSLFPLSFSPFPSPFPPAVEVLKRVPERFRSAQKNDLFISRNSEFVVQLAKAEKLFQAG